MSGRPSHAGRPDGPRQTAAAGDDRATPLPAAARRLFPHHPSPPDPGEHPDHVIERLLDEGDSSDLAWLVRRFGERRLARWLAGGGGRRLSRRSRALWALVLGVEARQDPAAAVLWPL